MNTLKSLCLLFALISACAAHGCKKVCVLNNLTCVTRGGFNVYKEVVDGANGLVKPLDPLYIDEIDGEMKPVKYKLTKITLRGLKKCTVTKLKLNVTQITYKQYLECPKLISRFQFEFNEDSNSTKLRGRGIAKITAYNYDILNQGKYSVFVKEIDHRPHFFIINHETKTHLNGKIEFEISKDCFVDSRRVNETETYMNKHGKDMEEFIFTPIIKRGMDQLIDEIDVYIRKYTMGEVLPFHYKIYDDKIDDKHLLHHHKHI